MSHIALYVNDIAQMRNFYELYFDGQLVKEIHCEQENATKNFLVFADSSYIELIQPDISRAENIIKSLDSMAHIGFCLENKGELDRLCLRLKQNKYEQIHDIHNDNTGLYSACFSDPEGNKVEITAPSGQNSPVRF